MLYMGETEAEEDEVTPEVIQWAPGEARSWTVCPSPKSGTFLRGLLPLPHPWTQAKGTSEPFNSRRESQALLAGLGFRAGSGTPSVRASFRLFSREPRELPSEAVGNDS